MQPTTTKPTTLAQIADAVRAQFTRLGFAPEWVGVNEQFVAEFSTETAARKALDLISRVKDERPTICFDADCGWVVCWGGR